MKKISIALALVVLLSLTFVGCQPGTSNAPASSAAPAAASSQAATPEPTPADSDKIVIGFSQCTLDSPFYVALMDKAKAVAAEQGIELIALDAQNDVQKQNNDIADLLTKGIDALILNPVDADGVAPAVAACAEKGVPIITVDRPINEDVYSFVGRDNKAMGQKIGEYAVELLGGKGNAQGKVLEVLGAAGNNVTDARSDGFHVAIDAEPGITVIQSPNCDYIRSKAVTAVNDIVQSNKDVVLIYSHNDDMSLGALQAFVDNNLKDVYVVGVDGLMEAVQAISEDGNYKATAMNDPSALGQTAVETALKAVNGETAEKYIDCGTSVIDLSNAKDFIDTSKMFAEMK